ncbi:MAG: DUF4124 domain-containing protein [Candidatus Thiodiazotropha sp. 6PLUC2]
MVSRTIGYFENIRELLTFRVVALSLFIAIVYPQMLHAGVYKWTDEQGRVHFSDRPVSESSTEVKIRPAPSNSSSNEIPEKRQQKMKRMLDSYQEDRSNKKEARQKAKKEKEKRKAKCIYAKDRYKSHNRARGIYNFKKDGERSYMSDAERQSHMKQLKADVDRWCK